MKEPWIGCAWCFKENIDMSETDEFGVFWTYCRACDMWTEHELPSEKGKR